jgi:hypothetical protein
MQQAIRPRAFQTHKRAVCSISQPRLLEKQHARRM